MNTPPLPSILHGGGEGFIICNLHIASLANTKFQDLKPNTLSSSTKYVELWGKCQFHVLTDNSYVFLVCPRTDVEYFLREEVKIADPDKKSTSYQRGLIPSARKASTNRGTFATNW